VAPLVAAFFSAGCRNASSAKRIAAAVIAMSATLKMPVRKGPMPTFRKSTTRPPRSSRAMPSTSSRSARDPTLDQTQRQRRYDDDVPEEIKKRRLTEIVGLQNRLSFESNQKDIGKIFKVLIEGDSKRSTGDWMGRNTHNKVVVFPKGNSNFKKGDYVMVKVTDSTQATLLGKLEE